MEGACIHVRGVLAAAGDQTCRVSVADSFGGLPEPAARLFPEDAVWTGLWWHVETQRSVQRSRGRRTRAAEPDNAGK